ncbi:nicotinate-nucleotide--dimethylbenzimidazole phosphoribosyltransferase [Acidocella aquatica]|uniref:Nicotinate-nucleotide--dimethylbenzimidazole phosphoribosyltransferase n=1 Tax=Acidocella aquatica TaxID=1922313 RepID=A0ABQ6A1A0_9PROT|nr:nicotinate-nucleotide--dimethylbenzimidazole phosphoribosyltransferase [Acidocella aquatica]GLR65363.1 nicotinate-nucleotide--dimethylbenzimidazole phosphoribosyltransferase [Acidocella aquatica]
MTAFPLPPIDRALESALQAKLDGLAKPPGALGRMEALAMQLGLIQQRLDPQLERAILFVFAGDHGLTQEGVSSYPASVTIAMVQTFLAQRASANAFARAADTEIRVVDAGVAAELTPHPALLDAKIALGTRNAAHEPAMTTEQCEAAITRGAAIAQAAAAEGFDVIALGEMGIGNTASAALVMHRLAPAPLSDCVGMGTGHDAAGLARKLATLQRAAARNAASEPLAVLTEFGGFEIAMMAGAVIGAARSKTAVLVDGFIASAAALAAIRLAPTVLPYCIFAHCSAEAGHRRMLDSLGALPLLDLGLRLGEGTGGLLCVPILRAAARILTDIASLDDVMRGNL